jgi:hypothetical protein
VSSRALALLWALVGVVVWNGFFDLYVSRGAREYLEKQAEFLLGAGPAPSMPAVMAEAVRAGRTDATLWALAITGAGWATIWMMGRRARA